MSGNVSTAANTFGVERRPSFAATKPATPKRYSMTDAGSAVEHTRVEDESVIEKKYTFGEVLGQGAFGVVKEVTNRQTRERLAMKIVQKDKPGSNAIQLLEREVEVLKRVNHPSIIQLEEVFETSKKMYLIMELCEGGELSLKLREKSYFKEEEAKTIMRKLTEALVYMHDNDMVHRDLKLENVLLSTADSEDQQFNIKVTDFGLAHMKGLPGCDDLMHSKCGTLYYMAPEVLNTRHEYTKMCDVWSLGVIMYTLLCGRVPFKSDNPVKLEEVIIQGELKFSEIEWINVSETAKELIKSMLCVDTSRRYTARKILDDPWFTGQEAPKTLNALDLMHELESETKSSSSDTQSSASSVQKSVKDEVVVSPPRNFSPHKKMSLQPLPSTGTPTKKKTMKSRAHSSVMVSPSTSSTLKNPSIGSIHNGKIAGHSSHSSGHSSHSSGHSSHNSSHTTRTRTTSVGACPRRPSSGQHHKDKKQHTSYNRT